MSSPFVVAIPSYGRSTVIDQKTLSFLRKEGIPESWVSVFVVREEEIIYRSVLATFISHGGKIIVGVKGLVQQRDFIQSYYP